MSEFADNHADVRFNPETGVASEPYDAGLIEAERRLRTRRRGFWWGVAGIVGYFILLVIVRLVWGVIAQQRLDAQIAEWRAAGQPVRIEDFAVPQVADADNAALLYQQAIVNQSYYRNVQIGDLLAHAWRRQEWEPVQGLVKEYLQQNATTFDLVAQATQRTEADWGVRLKSPVCNVPLPNLSTQRDLCRLIVLSAMDAQHRGDTALVLDRLSQALILANRQSDMQPFLITTLVSIAMEAVTCEAIETIGHALELKESPEIYSKARQLQELLLTEQQITDQYKCAIYGERLIVLDTSEIWANGLSNKRALVAAFGPGVLRFGWGLGTFLGPVVMLDAQRSMDYTTLLADIPLGQEVHDRSTPSPESIDLVTYVNQIYSMWMLPSLSRSHELAGRAMLRRRMAAITLALRLYELDRGNKAESLSQLVPDYLPSVPLDPFDPNGGEIRYLATVDMPRLYSVGFDHADDGGEFGLKDDGDIDWNVKDHVWFLGPERVFVPPDPNDPLPQTLEDNGEIEDAGTGQ
jgi:hypothetical protein